FIRRAGAGFLISCTCISSAHLPDPKVNMTALKAEVNSFSRSSLAGTKVPRAIKARSRELNARCTMPRKPLCLASICGPVRPSSLSGSDIIYPRCLRIIMPQLDRLKYEDCVTFAIVHLSMHDRDAKDAGGSVSICNIRHSRVSGVQMQ